MIPCEECLILPICRHKEYVKCSLLYDWWTIMGDDKFEKKRYSHLPILEGVSSEEESLYDLIYLTKGSKK